MKDKNLLLHVLLGFQLCVMAFILVSCKSSDDKPVETPTPTAVVTAAPTATPIPQPTVYAPTYTEIPLQDRLARDAETNQYIKENLPPDYMDLAYAFLALEGEYWELFDEYQQTLGEQADMQEDYHYEYEHEYDQDEQYDQDEDLDYDFHLKTIPDDRY